MEEYLKRLYEFYGDLERDYNNRMMGDGDYADMPLSNPFEEEWWEK